MTQTVRRAATVLTIGAAVVALCVSRPWPGQHNNRVVVSPEGDRPSWELYLGDRATTEEADKVGHLLLKEVRLAPGPNGVAVVERWQNGTLVVSLLFDPEEARAPHAAVTASRVLHALADAFPQQVLAVQVCRGPVKFDPKGVPERLAVLRLP